MMNDKEMADVRRRHNTSRTLPSLPPSPSENKNSIEPSLSIGVMETTEAQSSTEAPINEGAAVLEEEDVKVSNGEFELEEDTFSVLFLSNRMSWPWFFALFVFAIQIAILALIEKDLLEDNESGNFFKVPPFNDGIVTAAQFLALLVAVMSQDDCITSLYIISVVYDKGVMKTYPHATLASWSISNLCRFGEGFLSLFVTFTFIVQSKDALELFLNFVAVEFVANLDNLAFGLASRGFLKKELENATEEVKGVTMPLRHGHRRTLTRRILLLLSFLALAAGWAVIQVKQRRGDYLALEPCSSFSVTFCNEFVKLGEPSLVDLGNTVRGYVGSQAPSELLLYAYFSGTYTTKKSDRGGLQREGNRPVYYETLPGTKAADEMDPTLGKISYCEDGEAWVFTIEALTEAISNDSREVADDDCKG